MFLHAVSLIDTQSAAEVEDIILPLINDAIHYYKLLQLLDGEQIGDRTPSQFFRHLRSLCPDVPDNVIKARWQSQLSPQTRACLAAKPSFAVPAQQLADAQDKDEELQQLIASPNTTLQLKRLSFPEHNASLYCDASSGTVRPFVDAPLRRAVFDSLHSLSYPGVRCSHKLQINRYVWPGINKDCREWARSCIECQGNKIQRHIITNPARFQLPSQRFEHIHVDLIALPCSKGFRQCLTIIDRFTRFPAAIPLENGNTETIARAIVYHWISRYGVPLRITSYRGEQFESALFRQLSQLFAISHLKTTPYHQANGLVERLHRQLKSALLCHNESWYDALPVVLMGLRASWKNDLSTTPSELVYGEPIRLSGEFINPANKDQHIPGLLKYLKNHFHNLAPAETSRHGKRSMFRFRELDSCSHVLIRQGQIGPSFSSPYQGPGTLNISTWKFKANVRRCPWIDSNLFMKYMTSRQLMFHFKSLLQAV